MRANDNPDWRTSNVPWQTIWILAAGAALALALTSRTALAAPDGMGGVFDGIFSGEDRTGAGILATPELGEVLEAAPDGAVREIRVPLPDNGRQVVTYRIEPRSSFSVGDRNCRTFTVNARTDDTIRETFRIGCKTDRGDWHIGARPTVGENHHAQ